jgi:hypothetical protein
MNAWQLAVNNDITAVVAETLISSSHSMSIRIVRPLPFHAI